MNEPSDVKLSIASKLRQAREAAGLSQNQVSKILGLHRPSISEIEAGRRRVSADELAQFATIYRVEVQWLTSPEDGDGETYQLRMAARELSGMNASDLEKLVNAIKMLKDKREG